MLNEGMIINNRKSKIKSEMIGQIRRVGQLTPQDWERRVFEALMNTKREEVDFEFEDNQAGYYTWVRAFDQLIQELIEDGYVKAETTAAGKVLVASEVEPPIDYSQLEQAPR